MKSKNLIILSVWSAVTIIFSLLIALGAIYSENATQWLITMFDDWWILFLITLVFTGIISYFVKEQEVNVQLNFQNIGTKLDSLTKEVAEIKKALED
jgi:uncharacterized BrkB/YihY/UPF0761 family membrane protein